MFPPWHPFVYVFLSILALFVFRLLLHLLVRLISNQKDRPLTFRVDGNYDYIKGWRTEPENNNGDSDDEDKGGCLNNEMPIKN